MNTEKNVGPPAHEGRFLAVVILLPAAAIAVLGVFLAGGVMHDADKEEKEELASQAALHLGAVLGHAEMSGDWTASGAPPGRSNIHPDRPDEVRASARPKPPNAPPMRWSDEMVERLPEICRKAERSGSGGEAVAVFRIIDDSGKVLYASSAWPAKPGIKGTVPLAPPLGDGVLETARRDGGAEFREKKRNIAVVCATIILLLVAVHFTAGAYFMHLRRHERRDALRKADFFDCVSHDLKTPVAGIRLNAELLASGRMPEEKRRAAIEAILLESDRLAAMVGRLLVARHLDSGAYRYSIETIDLAALLESERQTFVAVSGGRVSVSAPVQEAFAMADSGAVRTILSNLVENAVKYSEGPIEISAAGSRISCLDRGPGIPENLSEAVFGKYFRVNSSLAQKIHGTGLGLYIAKTLAHGMGGDVRYEPREGGGSIFILELKPVGRKGLA